MYELRPLPPLSSPQAKNLAPNDREGKPAAATTQSAMRVVELQEKLPEARVLYVSATGASTPRHLVLKKGLSLITSCAPGGVSVSFLPISSFAFLPTSISFRPPPLPPPPQLYMTRLGTFGFPSSAEFVESLNTSGLGAMEMFAMGLKSLGAYVARTLSYQGAEFELTGEATRVRE